ncbi:MAG: lipid-A-disaccharide synthase N-terminal domain-containing protein [Mangrovibacterium sp.]
MEYVIMYAIGLISQVLFFARTILQWFKSEHEGRVLSPTIFWQISLLASIMMLIYGIMRNDAAILIGQILVYFIYIRNIQLKDEWKPMPLALRVLIFICPIAILIYLFSGTAYTLDTFLRNDKNPLLLMIWGIASQLVFISRFFYQWIYSENKGESVLPLGFWVISICGSAMTLIYAVFRLDPILLAAHGLSLFIYLRNILIFYNKKSLFGRIDIPGLNRLIAFISGKIN